MTSIHYGYSDSLPLASDPTAACATTPAALFSSCLEETMVGCTSSTERNYDNTDRLTSCTSPRTTRGAVSCALASVSYTLDGAGNPLTAEWMNGGNSWTTTYSYDELSQLETENHPFPGPGARAWEYDWVGNRLDAGSIYDPQTDQLLEGPAGVVRQYRTTGSLQSKGSTLFTYDYRELLSEISSGPSFGWSPDETLVRFGTGGASYQLLYDPTASVAGAILQRGPSGDVTFVRDPGGALVGRVGADGVKYYYFDALGSTVMLADAAGNVTDRYDYGAWGEQYVLQETTPDNPYRYEGESGYYTYYQYPGLGLVQVGDRLYEPATGRYVQQRGQSYTYAGNSATAVVETPVKPKPTPTKPPPFLRDGKAPKGTKFPSQAGNAFARAGRAIARGAGTAARAAGRVASRAWPAIAGAGAKTVIGAGIIATVDLGAYAVTGNAYGPFTRCGEWIGNRLFLITVEKSAPRPEMPSREADRKRRADCDLMYDLCRKRVRTMKVTNEQKARLFYPECDNCRTQCYWNADLGMDFPWPMDDRCNFWKWPKGHPYYPVR